MFTGDSWGGLLTTTHIVENYPGCYPAISGYQLMEKMINQAQHYGTIVKQETCIEISKVDNLFCLKTQQQTYYGHSVIWATGSTPQKLMIPGETLYENKGVSYCAVCDGFFFKNCDVAVIGGGNSALEEAIFLARIVNQVYLIHRRDDFRGEKILQKEVENNPKIQIYRSYMGISVEGDEQNLTSLKIKNLKNNQEETLSIAGLFIAIGHKPNTHLIKDLVDLDENEYVKAHNTHTKLPGFFVAGDVQDSIYRQAVTAAASGCIASMEAIKYLRNNNIN
jgi:thioredoxin reductase (NADPH)